MVVNPTKSPNSTEQTRRSTTGVGTPTGRWESDDWSTVAGTVVTAGTGLSAVPHLEQNRLPVAGTPHPGQINGNAAPHSPQNFARSEFSAWHDGHRITAAHSDSIRRRGRATRTRSIQHLPGRGRNVSEPTDGPLRTEHAAGGRRTTPCEGGAMTDQTTNPDPEDAEGHSRRFAIEDPGTPDANDSEDDDTQGHVQTRSPGFGKDDFDVSEGSRRRI
jgi:hypothetical protein